MVTLFSGGCDSTLVLYQLAMDLQRANSYEKITALSINHQQVPSVTQQKNARVMIKAEFERRELAKYVNFIELDINTSQLAMDLTQIRGLMQPGIWLAHVVAYCASTDSVYCGYHKGDDFWTRRHEAEVAFKNFAALQEKDLTLKYPLIEKRKSDIIRELKDRGLYDLCWYCEVNDDTATVPCGNCYPCDCHQLAIFELERIKSREVVTALKPADLVVDSKSCKQEMLGS